MKKGRNFSRALVFALTVSPASLVAAKAPASASEVAEAESPAPDARVFEPSYFSQFAPRNALDMVTRIPGFAIAGGNDQGQRGLGQADQNVLVNGARFSGKSESVREQLSRIPASDVVRIELVDGNTLDVPGLTGLVANVIYTSKGPAGQFRWTTGFRPHNTEAQLYGGEISVTGSTGALDYTVSLSNSNDRFGADGSVVITDAEGSVIEEQYSAFSGGNDNPRLATKLGYDLGGGAAATLNMSYGRDYNFTKITEEAVAADGRRRFQDNNARNRGRRHEIGGDLVLPLGPGKLKLIGLERYEQGTFASTLVDTFDDGSDATGGRFVQTNRIRERIARSEYGWRMLGADFQLSGEAAFNRLDRESSFLVLEPDGEFVAIDFPAGTGGVTEDRYETGLSISREISPKLSVQAIGTVEFSTIEQTGSAANSRSFTRPKGSLAATWKPAADFDLSLTLARRVSQLSFGDFLASVSLDTDNENSGNNELVPYQSWNVEMEANKRLGVWGSVRLSARQAWFEDFTDWIPLAEGGEGRGSVGDAERLHLQATATINLDPVGFRGARLDVTAVERWMEVVDPFTGEKRAFSYDQEGLLDIDFRHDVPQTDLAWGASLFTQENAPYSRRYEVGRNWEGPTFLSLFVEHKNVHGVAIQALVGNVLGARNKSVRTIYETSRPEGEIAFTEVADRRIGPIFRLTVSGNL